MAELVFIHLFLGLPVNSFLDRYYHNAGSHNQALFEAFFHGRFDEAWGVFTKVNQISKDLSTWSLDNLLIAHCCALQVRQDPSQILAALPPPPSNEEVAVLARYQLLNTIDYLKATPTTMLAQQPYPVFSKAMLVGSLAQRYGRKTLIETGTYLGTTPYVLSNVFDKIFTLEASPMLHSTAQSFFRSKGLSKITALCGNSSELIAKFEGSGLKSEDLIFFLDAHWSTGITSKEYGFSPISAELNHIMRMFPTAIVMVDDLRVFGSEGYPTIQEMLKGINGRMKAEVMFDQLILTPLDYELDR